MALCGICDDIAFVGLSVHSNKKVLVLYFELFVKNEKIFAKLRTAKL